MRQVGSYEILEELGRGANGIVFRGRHVASGRDVAVKVLLDIDAADEEELARFSLEAKIARKLRHPGIVGVLDLGSHGGRPYCVMELCEGTDLASMLEAGPLPQEQAVELLRQVAEAMAFAHREGVIHRDLKPANIVVGRDGRPRVTDFGLARDRSLQQSLTRTGDILGTPVTMAPEQLQGDKKIDHRVDVYALGATLYRCLTGDYPHRATSVYDLMDKVCSERPRQPSSLLPGISPGLDAICMRALEKDPDDRFPNCALFAEALQHHDRLKTSPSGPARDRRKLLLVGAGVLALALLAASLGAWQRARNQATVVAALDARIGAAAALGPTAAEGQQALELLSAAETAAEERAPQLAAIAAERRRRAAASLERARQPATPWPERAELLELAPRLDPSAKAEAQTESILQALALARLIAAGDDRGVPDALGLLRRLAADDPALLERAQQLEAQHTWEEWLRKVLRSAPEASFEGASAQLLAVRAGAQREGNSARVERVDLALAELCLRRGRLPETLRHLGDLPTRPGPRRSEAALLRCFVEWSAATWSEAAHERFAEVGRADPRSKFGLTAAAMGLLGRRWSGSERSHGEREERARQATALARAALALDPRYVPALVALARALSATGVGKQAAETLIQAAEYGPDDSRVFLAMSSAIRRMSGDLPLALAEELARGRNRYLDLTRGGTPTRTRSRILLGRAETRLGSAEYEEALRDYDEVLVSRPFDASAQFGRGLTVAALKGPEAATENWRLARALRPEPSRGRLRTFDELVARVPPGLERLRPQIVAAVDFHELLDARTQGAPEPARAKLREALGMAITGEPWAKVKDAALAARDAAPDSPVVALEVARIFTGRDLHEEAAEALKKARPLGADPLELDRLQGEVLLRAGKRRAALGAFQQLAQRDPAGVHGLCAAAEAALLRADAAEAARQAGKALALEPRHVPSLVVLSQALARTDPTRASHLAAQARSVERDLNSRIVLALLVANLEGIRNGTRAWIPHPRISELDVASRGAGWLITTARYMAEFRLGDPQQFVTKAARLEPKRADLHLLRGSVALTRRGSNPEDVLKHWLEARSLDPDIPLFPDEVQVFKELFPGVLEARLGIK